MEVNTAVLESGADVLLDRLVPIEDLAVVHGIHGGKKYEYEKMMDVARM